MNQVLLDANGHIEINDSMSDELKETILKYNAEVDQALSEFNDDEAVELTDEQVDALLSDSDDIDSDLTDSYTDDGVETLETEEETSNVSEDDLNNLNDLFM